MTLPTVDVLISTLNEERHVERCLEAVLGQDYPPELVRAWLIDGGSTDATVEIARALAQRDPRLAVFADGRRRNLPEALNVGLELGSNELVAKVDGHGYPELDFLRRAAEAFARFGPDVACVGGRPEQHGETVMAKAIAAARTSRFGVGGSFYAGVEPVTYVEAALQCGVYRRGPLVEVGGFDPAMAYGEDEEVNWRLRCAGYKILLDTSIRFHYFARASWKSAFRQYRNYGGARVRVVRKHPGFLRPRHVAPAALVAATAALAAVAPFSSSGRRVLGTLLGTYATAASVFAAKAASDRGAAMTVRVAASFAALHLGYGVGMLAELPKTLRALARPRRGG